MSDNIKQLHEVDQVSERLEELVRAIERTGMKVASIFIELKGPHQPGFVLRPVEDPAAYGRAILDSAAGAVPSVQAVVAAAALQRLTRSVRELPLAVNESA